MWIYASDLGPIDEISHLRQPDSLEAALSIRYALNRPRGDRIGNTLDLVPAEVPRYKLSIDAGSHRWFSTFS